VRKSTSRNLKYSFQYSSHATGKNLSDIEFQKGPLTNEILRAPLEEKSHKTKAWLGVVQQSKGRLFSRTHKWFTKAGRLLLIKSNLQITPMYLSLVLADPNKIASEIKKLRQQVFWKIRMDAKKGCLIAREKLCLPKQLGETYL
jgi:hypothetical protein